MIDKKKTRIILIIISLACVLWGIIFFSTSDLVAPKKVDADNISSNTPEENLSIPNNDSSATDETLEIDESAATEKQLTQTLNEHLKQVQENESLRLKTERLEQEVKRKVESLKQKPFLQD